MAIDPRDVELCTGPDDDPATGAVVAPIVQTALFAKPSFDALVAGLAAEHQNHVYTRGQNPTVEVLERKLAALERGQTAKCFASGMAAVSAVLLGLLEAGDHVVFWNHVYGPTLQLASHLRRFGIVHDVVLDLEPRALEAALRPETRLVWLESPGTMLFRTLDVAAAAAIAKERGVLTVIDNSWATPLFQKPLELGVDLVVHALSKYVGGHSDVIAGAVVGSEELLETIFYRAFLLNGGVLAPFDAWLLLRGLKTLPLRMERHEATGLAVARFLAAHPKVARIHHPGLAELPVGLGGSSGLFSFELRDGTYEAVQRLLDALRVFRLGVSWGGPESLAISPHREAGDGERLAAQGIPPGLVRLSIGLDEAELLIEDLDRALARA